MTEPCHLFILSGQSNMQNLDPDVSFTPAVTEALGADRVIVVWDALGGQPIQRWLRGWTSPEGETPETTADLYDRLMAKVAAAARGKPIGTVTFVWMQGERDSRMSWGTVYEASLRGLIAQVRSDLGRPDTNVVIGRISDFDMANQTYPHWTMVREIQVAVADADPRAAWVDTDDLNGPEDDLHYTPEGYRELGERFAATALELLRDCPAALPPGPLELP